MNKHRLQLLSEEASHYMNYGEHNYGELCKTKIWKKAKDLLLEGWREEMAKISCDNEDLILGNKNIYWCEECNKVQSIKFMTIHHEDYNWDNIFDPEDIIPMCISCHKKYHKKAEGK